MDVSHSSLMKSLPDVHLWHICSLNFAVCDNTAHRVCISGYPLSGYPDLSINFMVAKNPDILKWKSGCFGCCKNCVNCACCIVAILQIIAKSTAMSLFYAVFCVAGFHLFWSSENTRFTFSFTYHMRLGPSASFPFHMMPVPVYSFIHSNIKLYNKVNQP